MEKSPKVADENCDSLLLCKQITSISQFKTYLLLTKTLNEKVAKNRQKSQQKYYFRFCQYNATKLAEFVYM